MRWQMRKTQNPKWRPKFQRNSLYLFIFIEIRIWLQSKCWEMFSYMIIETIDTHFQNGRPKWRHFFTLKVFIYENGYHNMDCTHSPVILDFSSEKNTYSAEFLREAFKCNKVLPVKSPQKYSRCKMRKMQN